MSVNIRSIKWAASAVEVIAFTVFAYWILITRNSDTLYQAQNFSFFSSSGTFFDECMQLPGGFLSWLAAYCTQFFYEPVLGATVIIVLWLISIIVSKFALRVPILWTGFLLIPLFALLTSVVDNGYWLYYIKLQGFWFYATIGYLAAMLMTLVATVGAEFVPARFKVVYRIAVLLLIALTYPLFGIYSLAAVVYSVFATFCDSFSDGKRWLKLCFTTCFATLFVVLIPRMVYNHYANIRIEDIYTIGLPDFSCGSVVSTTPLLPFLVLLAAPVFLALLFKTKQQIEKVQQQTANTKSKKATFMQLAIIALNIAVVVLCAYITEQKDFQDYNYHAEIRMYKAMENQQWDEALSEMARVKELPDRQMILTKNVALINTGDIGSQMFAYHNDSQPPSNGFDTLQVHMVQTAAPIIYMYHGRTMFANRWCIENMVEYGKKFNDLKILTMCALVNGEMDLAKKYLSLLKTSMYYKEWAERYWPITEKPALIKNFHEFDTIRELHDNFSSILDSDTGLCELYLLKTFATSMSKDSKLFHELTLVYAMVQQDIQLFWPRFFQHAAMHKGEPMPIHYQEAAYLYGNLEKEVDISGMPFDKEKVIDRYNEFNQVTQQYLAQGMQEADIADLTYSRFGDTFYWFYFFCRNLNSY